MKGLSLFVCEEGWHLHLGRLSIWHLQGKRHWKPFRGVTGIYWLRFCFEWI